MKTIKRMRKLDWTTDELNLKDYHKDQLLKIIVTPGVKVEDAVSECKSLIDDIEDKYFLVELYLQYTSGNYKKNIKSIISKLYKEYIK